eukprot:GEMP01002336.1.p1 GENE.GEMP01002336.1~~GEMP01002336.1.p1  ORF type:complete len:688 (-),score=161.21 GEMP01002336.1:1395-3458(-)
MFSEGGTMTTVLVWTLRLLLSVLLFWTYYKFQAPKPVRGLPRSVPQKHVYNRNFLLQRKPACGGADGPRPLELMKLVSEDEAPHLFVKPEKKGRGSRRQRARDDDANIVAKAVAEDKMHLESLLNYVAFNRKEQRNFLPEGAPPPPPAPAANIPAPETQRISTENMERANLEAQMVLKAAVNFNRGEIAKDLWSQLSEANIEVTARTFTLLIEACVHAKDLKSASDFLMKMEAKGYCPEAELLDKVMELYSVQKLHRKLEEEKEKEHEKVTFQQRLQRQPPPPPGTPPSKAKALAHKKHDPFIVRTPLRMGDILVPPMPPGPPPNTPVTEEEVYPPWSPVSRTTFIKKDSIGEEVAPGSPTEEVTAELPPPPEKHITTEALTAELDEKASDSEALSDSVTPIELSPHAPVFVPVSGDMTHDTVFVPVDADLTREAAFVPKVEVSELSAHAPTFLPANCQEESIDPDLPMLNAEAVPFQPMGQINFNPWSLTSLPLPPPMPPPPPGSPPAKYKKQFMNGGGKVTSPTLQGKHKDLVSAYEASNIYDSYNMAMNYYMAAAYGRLNYFQPPLPPPPPPGPPPPGSRFQIHGKYSGSNHQYGESGHLSLRTGSLHNKRLGDPNASPGSNDDELWAKESTGYGNYNKISDNNGLENGLQQEPGSLVANSSDKRGGAKKKMVWTAKSLTNPHK